MEEQENVEHIVEIDKYIEVKLKIPKRLSAMDLKGLMSKTDKLFKLSEAKMVSTAEKKNNKESEPNRNQGQIGSFWTPEREKILKQKYKKVPIKTLQDELGARNMQMIHQKVHYMKKMNKW